MRFNWIKLLSYTILWNESPLCNYNYYCSESDTFSNGFWLKRYDFDILAKISRAIFIYFKFWKTSRRRMSKWKSFTSRVMKVSFYMTLIKIYLDWKPYVDIYLSWMFVRAISHLFCQLCHTLKSNTKKCFRHRKKSSMTSWKIETIQPEIIYLLAFPYLNKWKKRELWFPN